MIRGTQIQSLVKCLIILMRSVVSDSANPWTVACKAPLCMGFSRREYRSGLPCPPPGGFFPTQEWNPSV